MARLTDEELDELDEFLRPFETGDSGADLTRRALAELRERRAQDLNDEDKRALSLVPAVLAEFFRREMINAAVHGTQEPKPKAIERIVSIIENITRGNR